MEYLSVPLVLREGYLRRADLRQSISHSIGLLLSTRLGSIPFSPEFGCDLWEKEYSDLEVASKADLRAGLRNAIGQFERRLYNVTVSFGSVANGHPHAIGMTIKVSGNYRDDQGEEQKFESSYLLG